MKIGRLHVEAGGLRHKVGPLWVPVDLHLWWGNRGVHLYATKSEYEAGRVIWDRL